MPGEVGLGMNLNQLWFDEQSAPVARACSLDLKKEPIIIKRGEDSANQEGNSCKFYEGR